MLTWRVRAVTPVDVQYFRRRRDGGIAFDYSDRQTQSAVGRAAGVLGDSKKISVSERRAVRETTGCGRRPSRPTT